MISFSLARNRMGKSKLTFLVIIIKVQFKKKSNKWFSLDINNLRLFIGHFLKALFILVTVNCICFSDKRSDDTCHAEGLPTRNRLQMTIYPPNYLNTNHWALAQ